jgi:hypothetical protein
VYTITSNLFIGTLPVAAGAWIAALPRHLSALIGSLRGPADLGRNHDKYLTRADRE